MTLTTRLARAALITTLAGAASLCIAQGAASPAAAASSAGTSSPAKQALVQKALQLERPGIEGLGNALATQTANQVLQMAGQALAQLPADKREATAADLRDDVRKFYDEIAPVLRAGAVKLAPSTIGAALEEKFSEAELKVLVAWLESPVNKKYAQVACESQQALGQKLVAETRPQIDPKLKALEQTMGARLNAAAAAAASAPAAASASQK
jgi:hypothetical protein